MNADIMPTRVGQCQVAMGHLPYVAVAVAIVENLSRRHGDTLLSLRRYLWLRHGVTKKAVAVAWATPYK